MCISTILYVGMALSLSSVFEGSTISPANLHWVGFRWPVDKHNPSCQPGAGTFCDISARLVEVLVLLFPAFDVLSVYSVNCIILSNNLLETVWGIDKDEDGEDTGRFTLLWPFPRSLPKKI